MINVKNHFFERYCERILLMEDKNEIKQYIVQNKDRLTKDCQAMFEHSEYIYSGQLWDNITRNYYIRDNIILVVDTTKTALITLFRCDFGFGDKSNKAIVDNLKEEIRNKQDVLSEEEEEIKTFIENKEHDLSLIEKQMRLLDEQKLLMVQRRDMIKKEIDSQKMKKNIIQKDIDKLALTLCSSMDYKKELAEGKVS